MSQINNISGSTPVQKVYAPPAKPTAAATPAAPSTPARAADKLELSGAGHLLKAAKANDVRADKVRDVKAQIAAGTYETPEKLDAAANKLLDDLLG